MTKRIGRFIIYGLSGLLVLVMFSCYPSGPTSTAETDVVITSYDNQFNFATVRTYALPDEVFEIEGTDEVNHDFDDLILDEIEKNMNARGYVREFNPAANGADIIVTASIARTERTWISSIGWWGWWGRWPGWGWWPGWGPGWGIRYPWPIVGTFSTGTLFIEIVDPNGRDDANQQLPARWAGGSNGLLSSSSTITAQRIANNIAQMFEQSPYLGR